MWCVKTKSDKFHVNLIVLKAYWGLLLLQLLARSDFMREQQLVADFSEFFFN